MMAFTQTSEGAAMPAHVPQRKKGGDYAAVSYWPTEKALLLLTDPRIWRNPFDISNFNPA